MLEFSIWRLLQSRRVVVCSTDSQCGIHVDVLSVKPVRRPSQRRLRDRIILTAHRCLSGRITEQVTLDALAMTSRRIFHIAHLDRLSIRITAMNMKP